MFCSGISIALLRRQVAVNMSDDGGIQRIKADLEAPSWTIGGKDPQMVRDMRWLIALVESQAREIEQLKSSSSLHTTDLLRRRIDYRAPIVSSH